MDNKASGFIAAHTFKEMVLAEIFTAYRESATVYQKTADPEIRRAVRDLKRCYDRAIHHLLPLEVQAEKLWDELGTRFSG